MIMIIRYLIRRTQIICMCSNTNSPSLVVCSTRKGRGSEIAFINSVACLLTSDIAEYSVEDVLVFYSRKPSSKHISKSIYINLYESILFTIVIVKDMAGPPFSVVEVKHVGRKNVSPAAAARARPLQHLA